jgi:spermidine synthase
VTACYLLLFLSGLAGLGYELVWTRQLSVALGHEMPALLAVLGAFFFGTALGAWVLDRPIARARWPGLWYAGLEALVGAWALALLGVVPVLNRWVPVAIGIDPSPLRQWGISFAAALVAFLPAIFAMGGTLPAMERLVRGLREGGRAVGGLYAANTFGAVAGVGLVTLFAAPRLGYRSTSLLLAAVNFTAAVGMAGMGRRLAAPLTEPASDRSQPRGSLRPLVTLFGTGLFGIGYEVLGVRVLSQVMENTVYSFAAVLSVFLLGTALGAALYQEKLSRKAFRETLALLLQATAASCLTGTALLFAAEPFHQFLRGQLGGSPAGAVLAEAALALAVLLLPTVAMGALFSHLAQEAAAGAGQRGLGRALGLNTLGASLAPALFGVVLLPRLGPGLSLVAVSAAYLLLAPLPAHPRERAGAGALSFVAVAWLLGAPSLRIVTLGPGERILDHREGVTAAVSVVEDRRGDRHLKIDNHFQMGGTSSVYSDRREADIPLLLHPAPKRALFLGLGTGATLAAASAHTGLVAEGVELVPEVLPMLGHFRKANDAVLGSPNLTLHVADARRFVRAANGTYDVIVADLFHPARDGAAFLYTREHFEAVRARLAPGGLFCQWLPLYQLELETLRTVARTFLQVFPDGEAYLAHFSLRAPIVGLVHRRDGEAFDAEGFARRLRDPSLLSELRRERLDTRFELFGGFLAGPEELRAFAGEGPANTDDRPIVLFEAPRFTYEEGAAPPEARLLALIDAFHPRAGQAWGRRVAGEAGDAARLEAYWAARDRFLHAGAGVEETRDVQRLLRAVEEPLLEAVRLSPDFGAAYNPLLAMAYQLYGTDPGEARSLLLELESANPARPEAEGLRRRLFGR